MYSFRRFALVLALSLPAAHVALTQAAPASNDAPAAQQEPQVQPPSTTSSSQAGTPGLNTGAQSVQARVRARREARRTAAIRDVYSHLYDVNVGMGYLRFTPGDGLQRTTYYGWNVGITRFYNQRLGVTIDGRGYYGTAFVGLPAVTNGAITRPAISTYTVMGGPTYRLYMQPKYSVAVRAMGGYANGNFSGDTNRYGGKLLGLWGDGGTYILNAGVPLEYNVSPALALRLTPEYAFTGFGSKMQASRGFTTGFVFRFGKQ